MQLFADSADPDEIRRWLRYGVIDGVTTNPSILLKTGVYSLREGAQQIAKLLGDAPLSVEVVSDDPEDMVERGREIAGWASNIVVKVPVITSRGEPCLGAIHALSGHGIKVNATACLSAGQAMLAAKAGAAYVSVFAGRIADEGLDATAVIDGVARWLDRWNYGARLIVGSIRGVIDIQAAALAGAHVVTVPPRLLSQMMDHKYSRFTVQQFLSDGEAALARMIEAELEPRAEARPH
jgi:transaldolase